MGAEDCPLDPPGSNRPPVSPATYPPRLGSFLIQIRVHFKNQPAVEWLYFLLMILIGFISCSDELCYDCNTIAALSRGETEEIAPLILHWSSIGFWNWVIHNTSMKNIISVLKILIKEFKTRKFFVNSWNYVMPSQSPKDKIYCREIETYFHPVLQNFLSISNKICLFKQNVEF